MTKNRRRSYLRQVAAICACYPRLSSVARIYLLIISELPWVDCGTRWLNIWIRYKANPASLPNTVTDEATGEERTRLINRMRWKGLSSASIAYDDVDVCTFSLLTNVISYFARV
jgi:hypothetical protein